MGTETLIDLVCHKKTKRLAGSCAKGAIEVCITCSGAGAWHLDRFQAESTAVCAVYVGPREQEAQRRQLQACQGQAEGALGRQFRELVSAIVGGPVPAEHIVLKGPAESTDAYAIRMSTLNSIRCS